MRLGSLDRHEPFRIFTHEAPFDGKSFGLVMTRDVIDGVTADEARMDVFCLAVEQGPIATILTDPAGRIVYANAMFRQIVGAPAVKIGLPLTEFLPADAWRELTTAMRHEGVGHGEVSIRRAAREPFEARVSVAALCLENGDLFRFIVMLGDDGPRKARERALRYHDLLQTSRMESMRHLFDGFVHDIGSSLGAIIGFAGFLEQDLREGTTERLFADRVLSACENAKDGVAQILPLARTSGAERRCIDMQSVLRDCRKLLSGALPSSCDLAFRIGEEMLPVYGNEGEMRQMVVNLCLNANDALFGGLGSISVDAAKVRGIDEKFRPTKESRRSRLDRACRSVVGGLDEERTYLRLRVTDTGRGIKPEILARIFEPFFTTKAGEYGVGLGLPTVQGIVMSSGGAYTVESRRREGTVFSVYLPLVAESGGKPDRPV